MKLRVAPLAALLLLLVVKAAVVWQLGQHPLIEPTGEVDGSYYRHFGEMVAHGDVGLASADSLFGQPPAPFFLAPFYVYFLGALFKLSHDSIHVVRIAQIVLGTLGVGLTALAVRRWFGARAAWAAGALMGACGLFTFYEVLILPAALDPFFTGLDLWLLARAADTLDTADPRTGPRLGPWLLAGLALGVHALNRPHMAFVALGLTLVLLARRHWQASLALAAAVVLAILPVTLRNHSVGGQWVPIASNFGINVFMGNGPDATGTPSRAGEILPTIAGEWVAANAAATAALGHPATGMQTSTYFLRQAASFAWHHPAQEAALLAKKTWYSLSATFVTFNHSFVFFSRDVKGVLTLLAVGPALLIPMGIVGLWFARPRGRRGYGIWAAFLPLTIVSTILSVVATRFRLPALVMFAGLAGAGLSWMIDRWRDGERSALAVPAAAAAIVALVAVWPTRLDDGRSEEMVRMAVLDAQSGDTSGADAWTARAIEHHAPVALTHVRVGQTLETSGKPADAIGHYKAALAADPQEPALHFVLGRAYMGVGDFSGAVRELAGARVGAQQDAASRLLAVALARANRTAELNTILRDLDPRIWDVDTARQFAMSIADAGRVDLSIPAWMRAADVSGSPEDYERLGLSFAMLGSIDDALQALAEAVSRAPATASYRLNLAVALARSGRPTAARDQINEALKIDPNYEPAQQFLAALNKR